MRGSDLQPSLYRSSITVKAVTRSQGMFIFVIDHKRELFDGLIRIHVLLHAAHGPSSDLPW